MMIFIFLSLDRNMIQPVKNNQFLWVSKISSINIEIKSINTYKQTHKILKEKVVKIYKDKIIAEKVVTNLKVKIKLKFKSINIALN